MAKEKQREPGSVASPKGHGEGTARRTVVHLDLVSYTDKARELEEQLDAATVMRLNQQIQGFVDQGLAEIGQRREDVVNGTAGDSALLFLPTPAIAHLFAEAVHQATVPHNRTRTLASAERWFRIGVATGEIVTEGSEAAGITIANAVRLEAAAALGQILVDAATHEGLPPVIQSLYAGPETVSGKRAERLPAWRHTAVLVPAVPTKREDVQAELTGPPVSTAASSESEQAPAPAPELELKDEDLRELLADVAKEIEEAIGDKAKWFRWLGRQLRGRPANATGLARELVKMPVTSSLGLVVTQVKDNLSELPSAEHDDWLGRAAGVMNQLLRLVAHPGYVSSLRKQFDVGARELTFRADRRSLVAVLLACMFEREAELCDDPDDPYGPRDLNALGEKGIPECGPDETKAVEEVRRYVWDCLCPARVYTTSCEKELKARLKAARQQLDPWYLTVPFGDDAPWGAIAKACEGLLLLRVRTPGKAGHILVDQETLRFHLSDLVRLFGQKEVTHA
jgi:class 3 adenylate cyclase